MVKRAMSILFVCLVLVFSIPGILDLSGQGTEQEAPYVFLRSWGNEIGIFDRPAGIAFAADRVYVVDQRHDRVQVFDAQGTPLAVLEAMACGLPVVATRHAGIPDVVEEGVSGLLSEEGDLDAMAQHLLRLAGDPARPVDREQLVAALYPNGRLAPDLRQELDLYACVRPVRYFDGVPSEKSTKTIYDFLDTSRAVNVYLNSIPALSVNALREGQAAMGADTCNKICIWDSLMDSKTILLTGNTSTVAPEL